MANARYNELLLEGKSWLEAQNLVITEMDTLIENAPTVDVKAISGKTSQREFARRHVVTAENVQRVIDNPSLYSQVFGGISQADLELILAEKAQANELTPEQINRLFD